MHFEFPKRRRRAEIDRQLGEHGEGVVGGVQHRQRAAEREQAGGGEEGGAVLERGHDLHVDHARLAVEQAAHPDLAIAVHPRRQAVAAIGGMLERCGIDQPFDDEEGDRQNIDRILLNPCSRPFRAFSGAVGTGSLSRKTRQNKNIACLPIQSERKRLYRGVLKR